MEPADRQLPDILEEHGMSKGAQKAAAMRAATFDPSEFEGEYEGPGTYTSTSAQMLRDITQHRARELKVKKAYEK
jgi:hypothetical protein